MAGIGSKYRCEGCGNTFENDWTEEEANAEAMDNFGVSEASKDPNMAIVCDDCYEALMSHMAPEMMETTKKLWVAKFAVPHSSVDMSSMISEGDLRYPFWPIAVMLGEEERVVMDWIDGVITLQSFEEASKMFSVFEAQSFAGRMLFDGETHTRQDDYCTQCLDLRDGLILAGKLEFVEDRFALCITAGRGVINNYATSPISVSEDE